MYLINYLILYRLQFIVIRLFSVTQTLTPRGKARTGISYRTVSSYPVPKRLRLRGHRTEVCLPFPSSVVRLYGTGV